MARDIERKFPVTGAGWRAGKASDDRPGYLSIDKQRTVRIRVSGDTAHLTVKGITEDAADLSLPGRSSSPHQVPGQQQACHRTGQQRKAHQQPNPSSTDDCGHSPLHYTIDGGRDENARHRDTDR